MRIVAETSFTEELGLKLPDHYRVESQLGRGGMGTVFRARDLKHGRAVAIKVLHPELSHTVGVERFQREIQIAAGLQHPHILPVLDSGDAGGSLFFVMPLVEGESLRARLNRESQLPIDEAIGIAAQVADALSCAHSHGVIHRDIKPDNILLSGGHAVVADFGLARAVYRVDATPLTQTGVALGTPLYMSPEQFAGTAVDGRADLYSLACVVYEMLVGQAPFTGPNPTVVMARHSMDAVPSIRVARPSVSAELEAVIARALAKVPADRFRSLDEFKTQLLGHTGPAPAAGYVSPRSAPALQVTDRRMARSVVVLAAGAALVLLSILGINGARFIGARLHRGTASGDLDLDPRRIGVLYFLDESRNGSLQPLADGLTESLIERLSAVPALDVISRSGVQPFRGREVGADSVARALKVGSIVRGSVAPGPDSSVRVTVRLVDDADVEIARKEIADHARDALALENSVADQVALFLREHLGSTVQLREEKGRTKSTEAWMLVQRAEKRRKDADSLARAGARESALAALGQSDELLAQSERVDPHWPAVPALRSAVAYAKAQTLKGAPTATVQLVIDSGVAYAKSALDIDEKNADALEYEGKLLYLEYSNLLLSDSIRAGRALAQAESTLGKAVRVNRNQAGAWDALSALQYRKPDLQAAYNAASKAYEADAYLGSARSILLRLFQTAYNLEQFPEATKWLDEGSRRFPNDPSFVHSRLLLYWARVAKPNPDSAWGYYRQLVQLTPEKEREFQNRLGQIQVAGALVRASLPDSARRVLLRARLAPDQQALDKGRDLSMSEAAVRVMLGDYDMAVDLMRDYMTLHPDHKKGFARRVHWRWRDLQGNSKFQALIADAR
ncbi:MAG: protein kinase domain-containing protein [Gemmatimonadaceae bacterium]